ncbi:MULTISPECIES: DUF4349 domain-containing protein [unclassified Janthinobacterium]|uniref:DUF4349 domain-containing protein n=1 Tax=unclassified Janthinobacterium TaxID=2610881 RepID=UPI00034837E0|nr:MULTISPECIES: DUF4349 domain-containing protein [unclassified Janthinobacterium]MEC5160534.1 hypothetical protein [Janthinobacterium sp. CG_S6]
MKVIFPVLIGTLLLAGCGAKRDAGGPGGAAVSVGDKGKGSAYLAYAHSASVDTAEDGVRPLYDKLVAACKAEPADGCVLLDSELSSGRDVSARVSFRAAPAGVRRLLALASAGGELVSQSTEVEDLAGPIVDSNKRLDMLKQYQKKLQELERRAERDVDALIKVSRELATIQSELEQASGDNARLMERVNKDVLKVSIGTRMNRSFWTPVRRAMGDFSGNLSSGMAGAITGMAYMLPWILAFLLLFPLGRKAWRKIRS